MLSAGAVTVISGVFKEEKVPDSDSLDSSKTREESPIWGLVHENEPFTLKTWGNSLDPRTLLRGPHSCSTRCSTEPRLSPLLTPTL